MPPPPQFHIVIIGSGIAGFAASIGIRRKGHSVTVLERTPNLQTFGGNLLIPPNAGKVIHHYNILNKFEEANDRTDSHMIYRHDGKLLDLVDHLGIRKMYGYTMYSIPRKTYQRLLYEAALKEGVTVRFGCRVESIDEQSPAVTLSSGEVVKGHIIIGADGIRSSVRRAVLGSADVQPIPESLGFQCQVPGDLVRADPLTADLVTGNAMKSWWGPNRQIISGIKKNGAFYDIALFVHGEGARNATAVAEISVPNQGGQKPGDLGALRKLAEVFELRVRTVFEMVGQEDCLLWHVAFLPDLPRWVSPSGRVTLLGDAAHAMTPHLGQGAASAIEDGACLAECISRARSPQDIPAALRVYEKLRKPRTERIKKAAEASGNYKILEDGPARQRRDEGFAERLDKNSPKYEAYRGYEHVSWLYGYDVFESTKQELDKSFGSISGVCRQSRI